jgi:hypothetical protein
MLDCWNMMEWNEMKWHKVRLLILHSDQNKSMAGDSVQSWTIHGGEFVHADTLMLKSERAQEIQSEC